MSQYQLYLGPYTVELLPGAKTHNLPDGFSLCGSVVTVDYGFVVQEMDGFQFYAGKETFFWEYEFIESILDRSGDKIWRNGDNNQ